MFDARNLRRRPADWECLFNRPCCLLDSKVFLSNPFQWPIWSISPNLNNFASTNSEFEPEALKTFGNLKIEIPNPLNLYQKLTFSNSKRWNLNTWIACTIWGKWRGERIELLGEFDGIRSTSRTCSIFGLHLSRTEGAVAGISKKLKKKVQNHSSWFYLQGCLVRYLVCSVAYLCLSAREREGKRRKLVAIIQSNCND